MNKFESVDEYIETYEGKAKEYLQQLRNIIKTEAPDCTELINYNIAAYALVDGGKRNEQIMLLAQSYQRTQARFTVHSKSRDLVCRA